MKSILNLFTQLALIALIFTLGSTSAYALRLISIETDKVIVCPGQPVQNIPPSFTEAECSATLASKIDPQNADIWVKAHLKIPAEMLQIEQPYSVYISGKTSSAVYFNGQYLGQNGTPSFSAKDEFAGKIDASFYLPPKLIKPDTNELVIHLSSHHGFLTLQNPLHFIGFGAYGDPSYFLQRHIWTSIIPLGALILGVLYFLVASFNPISRRNNILLLLMSLMAACQLFAEISRPIINYPYPFHDLRLMLIVSLAVGFGICLLIYLASQFAQKNQLKWIASGVTLTLLGVFIFPGFDGKNAIAIFIPSALSLILISIQAIRSPSRKSFIFCAVLLFFIVTIVITINYFHDVLFYYIVTAVLCFLFVQRALELAKEQAARKAEEQQVAKLRFKLEQNSQKLTPDKIKISSAGKIELIASNLITFCKAAGDYVEVYLKNKKQILYSGNLKELESQLPSTFLRVHRSYLVNLDFVSSLKKLASTNQNESNSSGVLLLNNGDEVPVSRRIMPMVRAAINQS